MRIGWQRAGSSCTVLWRSTQSQLSAKHIWQSLNVPERLLSLLYLWLVLQLTAVLGVSLALAALAAFQAWLRPRVFLLDFVAKRPDERCARAAALCVCGGGSPICVWVVHNSMCSSQAVAKMQDKALARQSSSVHLVQQWVCLSLSHSSCRIPCTRTPICIRFNRLGSSGPGHVWK
jgi:hypothetical protein